MEIRDLLTEYKFDGDNITIVRGSALQALNGETGPYGKDAVVELMKAVDEDITLPPRAIDEPFTMAIEGVYSIGGRGTVVTGRVDTGVVKTGDDVEIIGLDNDKTTTCTGVQMFHKDLDRGEAGDNVGCLLRSLKRDDVMRGQVIAAAGTVTAHKKFKAELYALNKDEGGRHKPFFTGYKPSFFIRTADVTGTVTLPEGTEMVMPGDNVTIEAELMQSVVMKKGTRFAVREGGRTVGAGVVTEALE